MLIAARDLVRRKGGLSRAEIRTGMSGNLCRCTGYMGIINAIARVMAERAEFEQELPRNANTWLGPAPGPVAQAGRPAAEDTKKIEGVAPSLRRATRTVHEPVHVTVGKIEEADGSVRLAQSFVLKHGRGAVWQLMSDPEAIARCMPGARLDGPPQDGRITGRIEVRLGPISASFAGEGTVKASPAEYRQVIEGRGLDRKSGSRVAGSVDYRLSDVTQAGEPGTQVDVVIGYALTGMLAQFGRSKLARDLALRIGESFAQNVDATLRDPSTSLSELQLSGLSLLYQVIAARVRALFGRIFGT
jgi:carbon-monoxide dehydrogenase small subunit